MHGRSLAFASSAWGRESPWSWIVALVERFVRFASRLGSLRPGRSGPRRLRRLDPGWSTGRVVSSRGGRLLANDGVDDETRRALAKAWRRTGHEAHRSVGCATRRAFELTRLDAPPALVVEATEVALEEIERTKTYLSIAAALERNDDDERDERNEETAGPASATRPAWREDSPVDGALARSDLQSSELARLAVDTLLEGLFAKDLAARVEAKLARRTPDPALQDALRRTSAGAARHAAHAGTVLAWAVHAGGGAVRDALEAAMRLLDEVRWPEVEPAAARLGGWERWGIAGDALTIAERARTWRSVEERVHALFTDAA